MLPGHLKPLFKARRLLYREPVDYSPESRCTRHISGVAGFLAALKSAPELPPPTRTKLQDQRLAKAEKQERNAAKLAQDSAAWDPKNDPLVKGDPFCTLFVGRLSYTLDEADLDREFAKYGPIDRIRIVRDENNKSRGYAFIVFEQEPDAQRARREAMGALLKGRRIVTDFERGRTQSSWKPRRLGGGRGGRNAAKRMLEERRERDNSGPPRRPAPRDFRRDSRPPRDNRPRERNDSRNDYRGDYRGDSRYEQRRDTWDRRTPAGPAGGGGPIRTERKRVLRKY